MQTTRLLIAAVLAMSFLSMPAAAQQQGFAKKVPAEAGQSGGTLFERGSAPGEAAAEEDEEGEGAETETSDSDTPAEPHPIPPSIEDAPMAADLRKLSDKHRSEVVQFVIGNATFIMFHEGGHMLVSELGLPVLGREEDAVDLLASVLLLEGRNETLDKAITDAADGWFLSSEKMGEDEDYVFWGAHGLDEQRAYQIVCMMVGHDAEGFKEFADSIEFPAERREECLAEYEQARTSWFGLLNSHMAEDGKPSKIKVSYEQAPEGDLTLVADMLKEAQLLESAAGMFADLYKLEDGIKFTAKACGEANAYWYPGEREITFCYEFAQFHMALITEWFINNPDAE